MGNPDVDMNELEINFPCASPEPYTRWDWDAGEYDEILICDEASVDLARLNGGASVLKNHNPEIVLGKVLKAWIEDGRVWVRVKFRANDPDAVAYFKDIAAGTLQNVSIGYIVNEYRDRKEDGRLIRDVTGWSILEVSVAVGVPADPTVGFYRDFFHNNKQTKGHAMNKNIRADGEDAEEKEEKEPECCKDCTKDPKDCEACDKAEQNEEDADGTGDDVPEEAAADPEGDAADGAEDPAGEDQEGEYKGEDEPETKSFPGIETRNEQYRELAATMGVPYVAERAIRGNYSREKFRSEILKSLNIETKTKKGTCTMSKNEHYNLAAALRGMLTGKGAEFEREVSDEMYRTYGLTPSSELSIMIPFNRDTMPSLFRAFPNDGFDGTSGAGLVATENRPDMFLEIIRNKIGVKNFTPLTGLTTTTTFPVQTTASTVGWINGINADAGETNPVISNATLTPHKLSAYVAVGRDLLLQGNPSATNIAINDLTAGIARTIGTTILKGNASDPAISGINTATGVQTVTIASIANATWANMLAFAAAVEGKEISGKLEFVMSAADKATFKSISKDTGSGRFLCEDGTIDGYDVSVDGTLSSGEIFFGDFSNVLVGQWGGLEMVIDPYRYARSGGVEIIATLISDILVRHPECFVKRVASAG